MANHRSAIKATKQQEKRRIINRKRSGLAKRSEKEFLKAVVAKDFKVAEVALTTAQSWLAKGVSKGIVHKNKLARKVARWQELLQAIK